jgi:hypothetical protein
MNTATFDGAMFDGPGPDDAPTAVPTASRAAPRGPLASRASAVARAAALASRATARGPDPNRAVARPY